MGTETDLTDGEKVGNNVQTAGRQTRSGGGLRWFGRLSADERGSADLGLREERQFKGGNR
jgi:hypothetical protein